METYNENRKRIVWWEGERRIYIEELSNRDLWAWIQSQLSSVIQRTYQLSILNQ